MLYEVITKARELRSGNDSSARDGIQIILKAGEYQLQAPILLEPKDSNTTIRAAKDAKVTISGGQHVTGWQQVGKYIYKAHLDRDDVYITNIVKCRPPGNRDPEPDEVATCRITSYNVCYTKLLRAGGNWYCFK